MSCLPILLFRLVLDTCYIFYIYGLELGLAQLVRLLCNLSTQVQLLGIFLPLLPCQKISFYI
jgi:hypothetical protein